MYLTPTTHNDLYLAPVVTPTPKAPPRASGVQGRTPPTGRTNVPDKPLYTPVNKQSKPLYTPVDKQSKQVPLYKPVEKKPASANNGGFVPASFSGEYAEPEQMGIYETPDMEEDFGFGEEEELSGFGFDEGTYASPNDAPTQGYLDVE